MGFAESVKKEPKVESPLEISELMCYCKCGAKFAKLRVSKTSRNPFRLFYNCPKKPKKQCGFFQRSDKLSPADDKHLDEINLIRAECIRLQERIDLNRKEHNDERAGWNSEKAEIMSQLIDTKRELDQINKRIKLASDLDLNLMPPCDSSCSSDVDEEYDDYEEYDHDEEYFYVEKHTGWSSTGDMHLDEINLILDELIQLQEGTDRIHKHHDAERAEWDNEKAEIISELTHFKRELNQINKKNKVAINLDLNLMPPSDSSSSSDDDDKEDSTIEKHTI